MKELTIEQKAKAYDKALERAKEFYILCKKCGAKDTVDFLEDSFSELCEPDDEKIRKTLLRWIQSNSYTDIAGMPIKNIIDWLENQGQEPRKVSIWKHWKDGICGNGEGKLIYLIKNGDDYSLSSSLGFECDYILLSDLDNLMLEKQGTSYTKMDVDNAYLKGVRDTKNEIEKKYEANYQTRKDIATFIFNSEGYIKDRAKWMDYLGMKVRLVEEQDEQKDSVVDFKAKDWYVSKVDGKIRNIYHSVDNVEPKFKVGDWVVHDMSDGRKAIRQIVNMTNKSYILDGEDFDTFYFNDLEDDYHLWTIQDAKDGDVLKEDSCTFIIERMKPDGTAIIHCCLFDDGDFDLGSTLGFDVDSTYPATKEQRDLLFQKMHNAGYEWDAEKKELKLLITNGGDFDSKNCEQEHTWSEKDENGLGDALWCCEQAASIAKDENEMGNVWYAKQWLKSLKDRVQPQQEWSVEDKLMLMSCIEIMQTVDSTEEQQNWLKSLRPQNRWKPTDEQMECLLSEVTAWTKGCPKQKVLESLYNDLKKLKA